MMRAALDDINRKQEEIARLRAEVADLKKDAERYRWLRSSMNLGKGHARIWKQDVAQNVVMAWEELDAAIDAALKEKL